jgi:hypothetical protein
MKMGIAEQYFAGMDHAQMFGAGQYFAGGDYDVEIKSLKVNNGHKGPCFIAEFLVHSTTNEKDPVGSVRSWVVKLGGVNKNAFSDIKGLAFALLGVDPKKAGQPTDPGTIELNGQPVPFAVAHAQATQLVMAACDPDFAQKNGINPNIVVGFRVKLRAWQKPTKPSVTNPNGGVFTVHAFAPIGGAA